MEQSKFRRQTRTQIFPIPPFAIDFSLPLQEGCSGSFHPALNYIRFSFLLLAWNPWSKGFVHSFTSSKFICQSLVLGARRLPGLVLLFGEMGEALPEGISAPQNAFTTAWLSLLTSRGAGGSSLWEVPSQQAATFRWDKSWLSLSAL